MNYKNAYTSTGKKSTEQNLVLREQLDCCVCVGVCINKIKSHFKYTTLIVCCFFVVLSSLVVIREIMRENRPQNE